MDVSVPAFAAYITFSRCNHDCQNDPKKIDGYEDFFDPKFSMRLKDPYPS